MTARSTYLGASRDPNPHYSWALLLQSRIRRCDKPGRGSPASRQAGSLFGRSTYCFKYASLPHGSARLSRMATARFRDEPSWI